MGEKDTATLCPHCGARNRITPSDDHRDQPHCRQCGKRLFPDRALTVDDDTLRRYIREDQGALLVDFWAPGCRPCKMLMPLLDQAARKHAPRLRVLKVNSAEYPSLVRKYRIRAVPTLLLLRKGKELDRITGALDAARLTRWINKTI